MMRVALLALLVHARAATHADRAAQSCLTDPEQQCDEQCPRTTYSRACLISKVPFRTPYGRVKCCLRCCLRHWLGAYGLDRRWAEFRAEQGGTGRIDDMLIGGTMLHGPSGTLPFASRRVSRDKMPWASERWTAEERAVEATQARPKRTPGPVTAQDRHKVDEFLWSLRRTRSANAGNGVGQWTKNDAWLELHFGDSCGLFNRVNPFGTYLGLSLASLLRFYLPRIVGNRSLTLVTSSDCDVPLRPTRASPFLNMTELLKSVHLKAWYANNPSDGLVDSIGRIHAPHPKLKAYATGVLNPHQWVRALDGREATGDRQGPLVCCCMAMLATPSSSVDYDKPREYTSQIKRVRERSLRLMDHDHVLSEAGMMWRYGPNRRGTGEIFTRVRRFAVLDELTKNGFDCADRSARSSDELRQLYFESDFVVSPQGKGRTNYREWEALAAGGIPLVDYDPSPAAAELYEGLPVVRVRNWKKVTPAYLDAVRERVFDAVAQGDINMAKLYLPYWLHEFTAGLEDTTEPPAPATRPPLPTCAVVIGGDPEVGRFGQVFRPATYTGDGKRRVPRLQARDCEQMVERRVGKRNGKRFCPPGLLAVLDARRACRAVTVFGGGASDVASQILADWGTFGLVTLVPYEGRAEMIHRDYMPAFADKN